MRHRPRWETAKEVFLNVLTLYAGGFLTWLVLSHFLIPTLKEARIPI